LSIEELKELVNQEKAFQEEIEKAKEKGANIIAKSNEEAQEILQKAKDHEYYEELFKKESNEIEEKKKNIETETARKIKHVHERTNAMTTKKAVSMIVSYVLEE
jgi:vacuolar-type H+-ATPase subunit H